LEPLQWRKIRGPDLKKEPGKTALQRLLITIQLFNRNGLANHAMAGAYGFLLSAVPALLLLSFFLLAGLRTSPAVIPELLSGVDFFEDAFDARRLADVFLTISQPGISGFISVISLLWAGRVFALSLQRGLRIVFTGGKPRNALTENGIVFGIELLVILSAAVMILCSRLALKLYHSLGLLLASSSIVSPGGPLLWLPLQLLARIIPIAGLGLLCYGAYRIIPSHPPARASALKGTVLCIVLFRIVAWALNLVLSQSRYNFIYGALGSLIILLANVYFFFYLFFFGAQFALVIDSFDALLFSRMRESKVKAAKQRSSIDQMLFSGTGGSLGKYLRSYRQGEMVLNSGDMGKEVYYLLTGEAGVFLPRETGDHRIDVIRPDSFFGEMEYILSEPRAATVKAMTDITVMVLPQALFDEILRTDSAADRTIIEELSTRLKRSDERITKA
jgi:uncharacterized BrkB/YihY/UPF0761 family membrane protein